MAPVLGALVASPSGGWQVGGYSEAVFVPCGNGSALHYSFFGGWVYV